MPGTGCVYQGSVQDVIQGVVRQDLENKWLFSHSFECGFEIGAASEWQGLGEMLTINGHTYVRSTAPTRLVIFSIPF